MDDTERFDPRRYKFWIEDHVRFSDLDPLGHVNNNAIGQYFENARAALFLKVMPDWPRQEKLFILAHIAIDFRRELHLPARLHIGIGTMRIGRSSITLANALYRENKTAENGIDYCESVTVLIDQKTRQPVEIPEGMHRSFKEYAG